MKISEFLPKAFEAVGIFHSVFSHPVYNPNNPDPRKLGEELTNLRLDLILEEWQETVEALLLQDKAEIADGLCDLLVVSLGACHCLNIAPKGVYTDLEYNPEDFLSCLSAIHSAAEDEDLTRAVMFGVTTFVLADGCMSHLNLKENFFRVHETNMAKTFPSKEEALADVEEYRKDGVLSGVYSRVVGGKEYFMIKRTDGKILKPKNWTPPRIEVN